VRSRLALVGAALAVLPMAPARAEVVCEAVHVPVALRAEAAADQFVSGELCAPEGADTVHILVSGSTYGHLYWDFPLRPERYSLVRALNAAGYATFNYDRIGLGESSYPPSFEVTVDSDVFVVHQLVEMAREAFRTVITVGHSHGSLLALMEARRHGDVDGVVLTGLAHNVNLPNIVAGGYAQMEPAMLEPRFAGRPLDPGYSTFREDVRRHWIHDPANVDADVLDLDEALKETDTFVDEATEIEFGLSSLDPPLDVPVLLALGGHDLFMCGAGATDCASADTVSAAEAPYFARVKTFVLPGAGHSFALERNAVEFFDEVVRWTDALIGPIERTPTRALSAPLHPVLDSTGGAR
jgi:alpha-beta hydrolase superfamily lysophospholipase